MRTEKSVARKVKLIEEDTYQVEHVWDEKKVTVFVAKGEKGDKGDKGEKGDPGTPGTDNYAKLTDKPLINDVTLEGNKSFEDLGAESLTNIDIEKIINSIV